MLLQLKACYNAIRASKEFSPKHLSHPENFTTSWRTFYQEQLTQLRDIILLPLPSNFSDSAEYAELNIAFEKIWRLFFYSIISLAKRHPSLKRDVLPAWILDPSIHFYSSIFDNLRGLRSLQYSVLIHIGDLYRYKQETETTLQGIQLENSHRASSKAYLLAFFLDPTNGINMTSLLAYLCCQQFVGLAINQLALPLVQESFKKPDSSGLESVLFYLASFFLCSSENRYQPALINCEAFIKELLLKASFSDICLVHLLDCSLKLVKLALSSSMEAVENAFFVDLLAELDSRVALLSPDSCPSPSTIVSPLILYCLIASIIFDFSGPTCATPLLERILSKIFARYAGAASAYDIIYFYLWLTGKGSAIFGCFLSSKNEVCTFLMDLLNNFPNFSSDFRLITPVLFKLLHPVSAAELESVDIRFLTESFNPNLPNVDMRGHFEKVKLFIIGCYEEFQNGPEPLLIFYNRRTDKFSYFQENHKILRQSNVAPCPSLPEPLHPLKKLQKLGMAKLVVLDFRYELAESLSIMKLRDLLKGKSQALVLQRQQLQKILATCSIKSGYRVHRRICQAVQFAEKQGGKKNSEMVIFKRDELGRRKKRPIPQNLKNDCALELSMYLTEQFPDAKVRLLTLDSHLLSMAKRVRAHWKNLIIERFVWKTD